MKEIKYFSFNGELYYTTHDITLSDLIHYFNYNDALLVLELNKLICNKKKWSHTFINDQDKIELVTIVGGG